jgi:hypothetical protein
VDAEHVRRERASSERRVSEGGGVNELDLTSGFWVGVIYVALLVSVCVFVRGAVQRQPPPSRRLKQATRIGAMPAHGGDTE